jgi:hypothetical protein
MKSQRLLAILVPVLACFYLPLSAQTVVDPVLLGQRTWTAAAGPYMIHHDTLLPAGSTLVIEEGTVVEISTGDDETIPNISKQVDWVIQGKLVIRGSETRPVKFLPSQSTASWGTLYVASRDPQDWNYLQVKTGRIVTAQTQLTLENCRITNSQGLLAGAGSEVNFVQCQLDDNQYGLAFWDAGAKVSLTRTRLWDNKYSLYFKAPGTLTAVDSSVASSGAWNVVNASTTPVHIPVLWWGTTDSSDVAGKVLDGRKRAGLGNVEFDGIAGKDPFLATVSGYDPGIDPRSRLWVGPKYFGGVLAQWVVPSVTLPNSTLGGSLGYGAQAGFVISPPFELGVVAQTVSFSGRNPALLSNVDLSLVQAGVVGRYPLAMGSKKSWFLFVQAGGLYTQTKLTATHPIDFFDLGSPLITRTSTNSSISVIAGAGVERRIGRWHKAELGLQYMPISLGNGASGSALLIQGGITLFFR